MVHIINLAVKISQKIDIKALKDTPPLFNLFTSLTLSAIGYYYLSFFLTINKTVLSTIAMMQSEADISNKIQNLKLGLQ